MTTRIFCVNSNTIFLSTNYTFIFAVDSCFSYTQEIPDFKTDVSMLTRGCRGGFTSASKVKYVCEVQHSLSKEISCNGSAGVNGSWVPDLMVGGQWPICSEGKYGNCFYYLVLII